LASFAQECKQKKYQKKEQVFVFYFFVNELLNFFELEIPTDVVDFFQLKKLFKSDELFPKTLQKRVCEYLIKCAEFAKLLRDLDKTKSVKEKASNKHILEEEGEKIKRQKTEEEVKTLDEILSKYGGEEETKKQVEKRKRELEEEKLEETKEAWNKFLGQIGDILKLSDKKDDDNMNI
jgi:hypothetical protein